METHLLHLIRACDLSLPGAERREAFGEVVVSYQDTAFAIAFSILRSREAAQDAALEGFVDAWRNIASLRDPSAFPGWLRTLVRTRAMRMLRRVGRAETKFTESSLRSTNGLAHEDRLDLVSMLESLPDLEREAVILFHVAGLSREETALVMGASVASTKKRLARSLARLRQGNTNMSNEELKPYLPSSSSTFQKRALLLTGKFAERLASRKPILQALDECIADAETGPVAEAFRNMKSQVELGLPIADAIRKYPQLFSAEAADLIYIGEELGKLDDVLRRLANGEHFESANALRLEYAGEVSS